MIPPPAGKVCDYRNIGRALHPVCSVSLTQPLACGIGTHAVYWAGQGHQVTAVDISQTFINEGKRLAKEQGVDVTFEVGDIKTLPYKGCFDVVTWVEKSFFDEEMAQAIHGYLADEGLFIMDERNPEHPRIKQRTGNWRTWSQKDGVTSWRGTNWTSPTACITTSG